MKMHFKSAQEFNNYIQRIIQSYSLNNEISPCLKEDEELHDFVKGREFIDLNQLLDETLLFVRGMHKGADYRIRITKPNKVDIWRNLNATGLTSTLDNLGSLNQQEFTYENGIIRRDNFLVIPYFSYEDNHVFKPVDVWMDIPIGVFTKK